MKKQAIFFLFVLISLLISVSASAQFEREIQVLEAFYSDDDMVMAATRFLKPRVETADNISVVTAEDIEAVNAHTVADVLKIVPGIFAFSNQDFGTNALLSVQGSEDKHVLVLLDGMRWNFLSGNNAETNSIPVEIVEKIEIIKGPASSTWGSSLGGVINIITKPVDSNTATSATLHASYGEAGSLDTRAQVSGKSGSLGYFLYAGHQESSGFETARDYENTQFFSKLHFQMPKNKSLAVSFGYSSPENGTGDIITSDITGGNSDLSFFINSTFNSRLSDNLELRASGYYIDRDPELSYYSLGLGMLGHAGELYYSGAYLEKTAGGSLLLAWRPEKHTVVLGAEIFHGELDQTINNGTFLQNIGAPPASHTHPSVSEWALFTNDTIVIGDLTFTAGLRFDHNSVSGSFLSPSLGLTYLLSENTVLRSTIARGFQYPALAVSSGGGIFLDPNPDLNPEKVWSYQLGIESTAFPLGRIKTSLFHYRQSDTLDTVVYGGGPPAYNDIVINAGEQDRFGVEVAFRSRPMNGFSFNAGGTYVRIQPDRPDVDRDIRGYNLSIHYDNKKSLKASLIGNYIDPDIPQYRDTSRNAFIWDFHVRKTISGSKGNSTVFFFTAHNLFDASQYQLEYKKNPRRWVEAGLRWVY